MGDKFEVHWGRRVISTHVSASPLQAVVDDVPSYGVEDDQIRSLGVNRVSWWGVRFKALLVPAESQAS
jgi:hypothetical protein